MGMATADQVPPFAIKERTDGRANTRNPDTVDTIGIANHHCSRRTAGGSAASSEAALGMTAVYPLMKAENRLVRLATLLRDVDKPVPVRAHMRLQSLHQRSQMRRQERADLGANLIREGRLAMDAVQDDSRFTTQGIIAFVQQWQHEARGVCAKFKQRDPGLVYSLGIRAAQLRFPVHALVGRRAGR